MDFRDSPEESRFRADAKEWISTTLQDIPYRIDRSDEARERNSRWWQDALYHDGWAGIDWPKQYGGRGLSTTFQTIFNEESAVQGAPRPINMLGLALAGPTIMAYGTEEQKTRFLPRILSGQDVWCQGFSEPGAGSDLAGLSTKANPVEDGWMVNGQKVWTSFAHYADRCMLLARTSDANGGPKHAGLTYFLASTDQFDVHPLVMANGDHDFNEVFLSDVFVSSQDVLGEVGDGWNVAMSTLGFERSSLAFLFSVETNRAFDQLLKTLQASGLQNDTEFQSLIARFYAEKTALRLGTIRELSRNELGRGPEASGSYLKLTWARLMQDITRAALQVGGPAILENAENGDFHWMNSYLRARGNSIEGGTDEIQLSIVAERILHLPKSR